MENPESPQLPQYTVKSLDRVYFTPVMPLVAEAWAFLEANGLGDGSPSFSYESSVFYVEIDGKPVGCLVWHLVDWKREAWIDIGYVIPDYRKHGIYNALYAALVEEAKKRKLRCISGGTDFNNTVMRQVAESQGRIASTVIYTCLLPTVTETAETDDAKNADRRTAVKP